MSRLSLILLLAGCLGPKSALEHWPAPALRTTDPVQLAIFGGSESAGPELALQADVVARGPDALVLTGDVSGATARDFRARQAWISRGGRPSVAVVGHTEAAGRQRFSRVHGFGPHPSATWGAVDIEVSGVVWRVLAVDPTAEGAAWQEQLFWVPKVASQSDYAHLIVVSGVSPYSLAVTPPDPHLVERSRELLATVEAHAGLERLRVVVGGGTRSQEVILPAGPWGELWLNSGSSGLAGQPIETTKPGPRHTELNLAPGLLEELGPGSSPIAWWELVLDGSLASLRLRRSVREGRYEEVWRIQWSSDDGWSRTVR